MCGANKAVTTRSTTKVPIMLRLTNSITWLCRLLTTTARTEQTTHKTDLPPEGVVWKRFEMDHGVDLRTPWKQTQKFDCQCVWNILFLGLATVCGKKSSLNQGFGAVCRVRPFPTSGKTPHAHTATPSTQKKTDRNSGWFSVTLKWR